MDYVENGNLHDYLSKNELEWDAKLKMTIDIALGLLECHDHNIIHLNINSENILVDKNLELKIAGFGFIKNGEFDNIENVRWAAPEYISRNQKMGEEKLSVMWEIAMNGKKPYEDIEDFDKLKNAKVTGENEDLIKELETKNTPGRLINEELPLIEHKNYIKLGKIISPPKLSFNEIRKNVITILTYIQQKIKMWGVDILKAENFDKYLIDYDEEDEQFPDVESNRLSRFDYIAILFALAEFTVIQDIFQIISQFPIAFPLLIPKLDEEKKYKVMIPLLTGPVIKWKTINGTIIENHLFKDSFKMIVTVRIGSGPKGKSTIINQLMSSKDMFTSYSDPSAENGIPNMIRGSIEFVWLTEETCGDALWNLIFKNHYAKGGREIILLANLHGDALDYPDQIEFLKQFSSCFLVYLMPGYDQNQKDKIKTLINPKKAIYNYVDPRNSEDIDIKKYTINTNLLENNKTIKKLCKIFDEVLALDFRSPINAINFNELKLGNTLQFAGNTKFLESRNIVNFIKGKTCRHIKLNVMQCQKKQFKDISNFIQYWQQTTEFQDLIKQFTSILAQPIYERRQALAHLEGELSRLSTEESSESRNNAIFKRKELDWARIINNNQEKYEEIRKSITELWKEVDNSSLGIEHFFRELGHIYKIFISDSDDDSKTISINGLTKEGVLKIPEYCAELLISGNTIELLDGDSTTISEDWFSTICNCINKKFPNLRVFVISILGLQSSGKSTLLNALFACKFAVSAGRCTKGFFMRLSFLEKELSDLLGIDAFILIDTEGLGAPEKIGEPESEKKDRMLATFAMGISNLTIINILGESMSELNEILKTVQVAIVTMPRLEKAIISPDILMVQHVTEKNSTKLGGLERKFREAFQKALEIAKGKISGMSAHNIDCLNILGARIKNEKFLKLFAPFKNGTSAYSPPSKQYHEDILLGCNSCEY
ncbi:16010_t:CDS:2 [Dentiscutata heterogama]|uniref:16010_t:CDS:1 n=1 Tax=Dentiscutata heterogama TaxID=1316150 RepID=A0ACA9K1J2_9GLOM|nr:16010_t:CDS:2 [Dentiscutata heterogama]